MDAAAAAAALGVLAMLVLAAFYALPTADDLRGIAMFRRQGALLSVRDMMTTIGSRLFLYVYMMITNALFLASSPERFWILQVLAVAAAWLAFFFLVRSAAPQARPFLPAVVAVGLFFAANPALGQTFYWQAGQGYVYGASCGVAALGCCLRALREPLRRRKRSWVLGSFLSALSATLFVEGIGLGIFGVVALTGLAAKLKERFLSPSGRRGTAAPMLMAAGTIGAVMVALMRFLPGNAARVAQAGAGELEWVSISIGAGLTAGSAILETFLSPSVWLMVLATAHYLRWSSNRLPMGQWIFLGVPIVFVTTFLMAVVSLAMGAPVHQGRVLFMNRFCAYMALVAFAWVVPPQVPRWVSRRTLAILAVLSLLFGAGTVEAVKGWRYFVRWNEQMRERTRLLFVSGEELDAGTLTLGYREGLPYWSSYGSRSRPVLVLPKPGFVPALFRNVRPEYFAVRLDLLFSGTHGVANVPTVEVPWDVYHTEGLFEELAEGRSERLERLAYTDASWARSLADWCDRRMASRGWEGRSVEPEKLAAAADEMSSFLNFRALSRLLGAPAASDEARRELWLAGLFGLLRGYGVQGSSGDSVSSSFPFVGDTIMKHAVWTWLGDLVPILRPGLAVPPPAANFGVPAPPDMRGRERS